MDPLHATIEEFAKADAFQKSRWDSRSKHADRNPRAHLNLAEMGNESLIVRGVNAYYLLMKQTTPVLLVFSAYWLTTHNDGDGVAGKMGEIVRTLTNTPTPARFKRCAKFIRELKRARPEKPRSTPGNR